MSEIGIMPMSPIFCLFHSHWASFLVISQLSELLFFCLYFCSRYFLFCAFCVLPFWNERVQVFFSRKHGVLRKLFHAFPRHFGKQVYWNVYTTNKCETRTTTTERKLDRTPTTKRRKKNELHPKPSICEKATTKCVYDNFQFLQMENKHIRCSL